MTKKTTIFLSVLFLTFAKNSVGAEETFSLPVPSGKLTVPNANLSYSGDRYKLSAKQREVYKPAEEAQSYLFEKQTFLTSKRDQAIKLLRQELNSGYRKNRDNVLLRLGQLYTEKYMELNFHEVELYARQQKAYEAKKTKRRPKLSNKRSRRYLVKALEVLGKLEREYPKHHRLDEVMFFIGFVNMEFGRSTKGAKYLERLVREYPKSSKYQEATLYLADHYFDKQQFAKALSKYRVLHRDENSDMYYYSLYKLAWCQLNLNDAEKGLRNIKYVIKKLEGSEQKLRFNIREQAINDIGLFFAETSRSLEAFDFYEDLLGKEKAAEKLEAIALTLHSKGKSKESLKAYEKLLSEYPDTLDSPNYSLAIYESKSRLGRDKEAVTLLHEMLEKYGPKSEWASRFKGEDEAKRDERVQRIQKDATNAAYYYHRTAQKTKKKHFYDYALKLYSGLEKHFPEHPEKRKIVFYQGEILYQQGKYLEASSRYMEVAKGEKKDKLAEESAYNALLSVDKLTASAKVKRFSEKEKKDRKFEKLDIPEEEQRFIEVSNFYLKEYANFKRATDVRYRIAGIYYRYHHFDKAAPIFEEIALKTPKHKNATTSAHLLLDIYNIRKDYPSLEKYATKFAGIKGLGKKSFKNEMVQLGNEVEFKVVESKEKEGKWQEAGAAYLKFYNKNPKSPLAEKSLYNSVVSYEKSGEIEKLDRVSALFVRKYPQHSYSKRLSLLRAKRAEERHDYQLARGLYEKYYRRYPKEADARKALYNAAVFAELLEDNNKALKLYDEYLAKGSVAYKEKRAIHLSRAKLNERRRNWRRAAQVYDTLLQTSPTLNDRIAILGEKLELYERFKRRGERKATLELVYKSTARLSSAKQFGRDSQYVAEARVSRLAKPISAYERIKLRLPPVTLVRNLKAKQQALRRLDEQMEKVVRLGNPQWGVHVLAMKGKAYSQFVDSYRGIKIPKRYKGQERQELEKQLKSLDAEFIAPFEKKKDEIYKVCLEKAVEFHVASLDTTTCRDKSQTQSVSDAKASGVVPKPEYWMTRLGSAEVASK